MAQVKWRGGNGAEREGMPAGRSGVHMREKRGDGRGGGGVDGLTT